MHNKLSSLIIALLISAVVVTPSGAHLVEVWSYDQYVAAADLVVVVEPLENQNAKDAFPEAGIYSPGEFEATDTLFKIHATFKTSAKPLKELTVLHFNYSKRESYGGALFIRFPIERRMLKGIQWSPPAPAEETRKQGKIYLAFLKARKDGRFEPVRGQYDARLAFQELRETGPQGD
jgi:hypothetical protein